LRRRSDSFPVSTSQGMGNGEATGNQMIWNGLLLPGAMPPNLNSGKLKTEVSAAEKPTSSCGNSVGHSFSSTGPYGTVERRFQGDRTPYEDLVDALYSLLVDLPAAEPEMDFSRRDSTCVLSAPE